MGVKIDDGFMGGNPNAFHQPISLEEARDTFTRWLGVDYDTAALDVMLAAAAVERGARGNKAGRGSCLCSGRHHGSRRQGGAH